MPPCGDLCFLQTWQIRLAVSFIGVPSQSNLLPSGLSIPS
jgi:hypothetical protein